MKKFIFLIILFCSAQTMAAEADKLEQAIESLLNPTDFNETRDPIIFAENLPVLIDFASKQKKDIELEERKEGLGLFVKYKINLSFDTLLRYLADPIIAKEIYFASAYRSSYLTTSIDLSSESSHIWDSDEPTLFLYLEEYISTSPRLDYSSWYAYLHQAFNVKTEHNSKPVFAFVFKQKSPSSVSRQASILEEKEHKYTYSNKKGEAGQFITWFETKLDDSADIIIFYPENENCTNIFVFSWQKFSLFSFNITNYPQLLVHNNRKFTDFTDFFEKKCKKDADSLVTYRLSLEKINDEDLNEPFEEPEHLTRTEKISILMQEFARKE